MHIPAVTVAIPAYSATYIAEALDSVFDQTFQDFEVVVVNDGSPDSSRLESALAPYKSRIRYIRQENAGAAAARNTAIMAAQAELIVNLDHDDRLARDHLSQQVSFMRDHPEIDACYVNSVYIGDEKLSGTHWMDHFPSEGPVSFLSVMSGRTCPANPGAIIRRSALLRVGLYDPSVDSWDDFDMWLRLLKSGGGMAYNRTPLVYYRVHGKNLSAQRLYYMERAARVLDKAETSLDLTVDEHEALRERRKVVQYDLGILNGKEAVRNRDWPRAIECFSSCLQARPSAKLRMVLFALRWCPWVFLPLRLRM